MCSKCDAKIVFYSKRNEEDRFKISNDSKLSHDMHMHPEVLK